MQLQGRNLELDLHGTDVRLLQFELSLLRLEVPDEEALENRFGEGTREAVLEFQTDSNLERTGEVEPVTARRINAEIPQHVTAEEALERLAEATRVPLQMIDALDPDTPDLRGQIERFSETLEAFTIALNLLRERDAPRDLAAEVEARLDAGRTRLEELTGPSVPARKVYGVVRDALGDLLQGITVEVFHRSLRSEQVLGQGQTDMQGYYEIRYSPRQLHTRNKSSVDLVAKAFSTDHSLLVVSPVLFEAPPEAEVDLTISAEALQPPTLFERIGRALPPLLEGLKVEELEENQQHQDLSFLSGETGIDKEILARFVMAHKLAEEGIRTEFWFALLGGSFYEYIEGQSLAQQLAAVLDALPSFDARAVRRALIRGFNQREITDTLRENIDDWVEEFSQLAASRTVSGSAQPTFVRLALEDAGIRGAEKQTKVARLFNETKALTPELLETLRRDESFTETEIADLRTSFRLAELTQGDFSVVKMLKEDFGVRRPEQVRTLAKRSEDEWVSLVVAKHAAGDIRLPLETSKLLGQVTLPGAEVYGRMLARQFRDAFPTAAFAGGLERAVQNGGTRGLGKPEALSRFLDGHEDFELLNTPVDDFLEHNIRREFRSLAADEDFRLEVKAVQRVFKLAPSFEATDALLADRLHSAQQIYRMGESEFVRRFADRPGFTRESVRLAWNRAADTHAAVLTVIGDLKALEAEDLPLVLKTSSEALSTFPNWNNLFKTGDLCECEHCRSVLGPAAYFADLLMFLKDRKAADPTHSVKDILLGRRPDLGFLELNCDNALTPLPYIDVVCEVLEDVVDAAGENDLELTGLTAVPTDAGAAKAAVANAFEDAFADTANDRKEKIGLGDSLSLSQVDPSDPDRWVAHGDEATYLLKKTASSANFFAEILRNTKASATELRAYPQYVNPKAYEKLREAKYPLTLPFDLFAEEVRAAFRKVNLQRWDLMRAFRGGEAPNDPTDDEIAAEYFGISTDPAAAFDEKRLILEADPTVAGQQVVWGETGNAAWLDSLSNVENFLRKADLEYNELLALLDLKFIDPTGDTVIHHLNPSCDTEKKVIQTLDVAKLDRVHRFLRLWRKLDGWKMWELDLVLRHPRIGDGALDEPFLIKLFYFSLLRNRLGRKATVEEVCALLGNLNTETRFTRLHEKRDDALYQNLFLNKRLTNPIDPAFQLEPVTGDLPEGETIAAHHPILLAALGIREADLVLFEELTKASDGTTYITEDLTLANLSFLWRHAWLSRLLKFKPEEWKILLKIFQQDIEHFTDPKAAWKFVEKVDHLKATGFTPDELNWLLAADRTAKVVPTEADAARFLAALRKDMQEIQSEYDPAQYDFLSVESPTDTERLTTLLTSLLQKLGRDEAATQVFIDILRDEVRQEKTVTGLPPGFDFSEDIKADIRIRYDEPTRTLRFTGLMTADERTTLEAATDIPAYKEAIEEFFETPRLALKFYNEVFTAPLANLPTEVDFRALPAAALTQKVSYDAEQRLLRFAGIMSQDEKEALDALSADSDYRDAVNSLATQPGLAAQPDERIWLLDADLTFPLRDPDVPANDPLAEKADEHLAENLATAATKALTHLSRTLSEGAVIQHSGAQLGLTEALTRRLLTGYEVLPDTLLAHLMDTFAATTGVVDYATLKSTFDGWFWASRVAMMLKKWKVTLAELQSMSALAAGAQLLDSLTLPLDETGPIASIGRFLRTSRLLRLRASLPQTETTLLEVLEKLNEDAYDAAADFAADVQRLNEAWPASDVEALIASLDLAYPGDYLMAESWERLRRAFYFIDNLNAGAGTVKTFAAAAMDDEHGKALKELLRSKFGAETWLTLSAEIQDVLREQKRDALAAYLLTQPKPDDAPSGKWENTNDLYAYYLLDVEMSSCQLTSRLVQGSGSVQLFVQRCFMGLEPEVAVVDDGDNGDSAWRWWKWMRKYRVWEANRKVFLWPENWIEPELKKDRSQFFKELENELLQNEINQYTVETAITNYLEKFDGVAQLEIAGFYQEDDGDNTIIHVFGRTPGAEPHLYYYRRYDYRQWTPWEKVDLDIQDDYLIPAVVNKRLFLFWPVFTEVPDEQENSGSVPIPAAGDKEAPVKKTNKKLRLQMAVSDYRQGKWTPKRISKDFDESDSYDVEIVRKHYRFMPVDRSEVNGRFVIEYEGHSSARDGTEPAELVGAFEISGCKGVPELAGPLISEDFKYYNIDVSEGFKLAIRPEQESTGEDPTFLKWVELDDRNDLQENDFTLDNGDYVQSDYLRLTPVLDRTPWIFRMYPPWHLSYLDKLRHNGGWANFSYPIAVEDQGYFDIEVRTGIWLPFFYNDKKRTFFVLPSRWRAREDGSAESVRFYYPEIKEGVRHLEDDFEGLVQTWLNSLDLSILTPGQRKEIEQYLWRKFLEELPPPYTDEQVKKLLKRHLMHRFHWFLGEQSLKLFQGCQWHFKNYYHPFVCDFARLVYNPLKGIPALMSRETQLKNTGFSFSQSYQPTGAVVKESTYPNETDSYPDEIVDFTPDGAYSPYNWELFFHVPLLIANSLSKNQRFEEARDYYHYMFNPLGIESPVPGGSQMSKYWITKPFFETTDPQYVQQRIDNILRMLAGDTTVPGFSAQAKKDLEDQVLDWRTNPFEPHRIANYRTVAYQKTVVMRYLDNLIAWGDNLFRQDSMESINEATQLYIIAAEILGPRPKKIPPQAKPSVESFNELETQFGAFSNALGEVENLIPPLPGNGPNGADPAPLPTLYFCIPQNDKMLGYWDTIADRLFKIRHCMNIEGVVRQLPLFEPPIDPGALVKAVAGGVDIGSALADLSAPLPLYRFNVLLQKANEVCNDVKALGGALLSALEKKDAEALSLLRQGQELKLLEAVTAVREQQIEEGKENLEGLKRSKAVVEVRRNHYRDIEKIIAGEQLSLDMLETAHAHQDKAQSLIIAASLLGYLPNVTIGGSGFGGSPHVNVQWGTGNIISALQAASGSETQLSNIASYEANRASTVAGYDRRFTDWKLQEALAERELAQIDKQITAAELRIAIAEKELENHTIQIENAEATDAFMRSKYTNEELYQWQVGHISGVYFQSYRLAYDLAKQAERCFRFELGLQDSSYINFGYWDSLKKGLLSGEKLQYDLRRLDTAYLEQNRREFELTKHVSLRLLDPLALVQLRETGRCFFSLPEEIFDLDYPGHYFRRIKSVSLTLPAVVGPYTTISCTLRLLKNSIRIKTTNGDNGYQRNTDEQGLPADDDRFVQNNIPVKAIAASGAQNDSGVFELSFRDERYLPFEGAGAVSDWALELFTDLPSNNPDPGTPDFGKPLRQFDYSSISDAVLHVKYTAREDAGVFKNAAVTHLRDHFSQDEAWPSLRILDLRQEFPTQWHRFLNPTNPADGNVFELEMSAHLFPIRDMGKTLKINKIWLLARCTDELSSDVVMTPPLPAESNTMQLAPANQYGGLRFREEDVAAFGIEVVPTDEPVIWRLVMTRAGGGNLQGTEVEDVLLVLGYEWE